MCVAARARRAACRRLPALLYCGLGAVQAVEAAAEGCCAAAAAWTEIAGAASAHATTGGGGRPQRAAAPALGVVGGVGASPLDGHGHFSVGICQEGGPRCRRGGAAFWFLLLLLLLLALLAGRLRRLLPALGHPAIAGGLEGRGALGRRASRRSLGLGWPFAL